MSGRILAMALWACIVSAFPAPGFAQCTDAEKKGLEEFDKSWGEAGVRGDRAFLQNVYANDFVNAVAGATIGKAQTIDEAVKTAERNRANPQNADKIMWDRYIITCTPNTATITHRNTIVSRASGSERTAYTRSVHVLEKRGDRWQVVSNAGQPLDDSGVLLYMEEDWNDAIKNKDAAWYERNYAWDASAVQTLTGNLQSKADVLASLKTDKTVIQSLQLSDMNVRVDGNMAIVTGVNHAIGRDEQAKAFERRVRFTDTFIRRDGRWLVWATQGTVIQ